MSRLQWSAVGAVLVLGILSQIVLHDHGVMAGHAHEEMLRTDEDAGIAVEVPPGLDVLPVHITGMT